MTKKSQNNNHSKSYKTTLSRLYILIIFIIISSTTGFLIIEVTKSLNSMFELNTKTTSNIPKNNFTSPINQSTKSSIDELKTSSETSSYDLPSETRITPFN